MINPLTRSAAGTLCAILLACALSACGTTYRLALDPVATQTRWMMGRNFAYATDSLAVVSAAFERSDGDNIHFDVQVQNLSADTVLVAPERFTYTVTYDSLAFVWKDTLVAAIDPEPMLRSITRSRENEQSDYRSHVSSRSVNDIANGIFAVARVVGGDGDKGSDEERRIADSTVAADRAAQLAGYLKRDEEHEETMTSISNMERDWNAALRKTSLARRESVQGRVIFPSAPDARAVKLSVPVGARTYTIIFRQRKE